MEEKTLPIASCPIFFTGEASGEGYTTEISEAQMTIRTAKKLVPAKKYDFTLKPKGELLELHAVGVIQKVIPDPFDPGKSFLITVEFIHGLKDFEKLIASNEELTQRKTIIIKASAPKCFEAICDFKSYPKWVKILTEVSVIGSNEKRPATVKLGFNLFVKQIQVFNRYIYDEANFKMEWEMRRGTLHSMTGSWQFVEQIPGKTEATLKISLILGFPVPKIGLDYVKGRTMIFAVNDFKEYVENLKP